MPCQQVAAAAGWWRHKGITTPHTVCLLDFQTVEDVILHKIIVFKWFWAFFVAPVVFPPVGCEQPQREGSTSTT
jgi:hypothetical protein